MVASDLPYISVREVFFSLSPGAQSNLSQTTALELLSWAEYQRGETRDSWKNPRFDLSEMYLPDRQMQLIAETLTMG